MMKSELKRVLRAVLRFSVAAYAILGIGLAPVWANPTLAITEFSDTTLTVTLDGVSYGTVTNVGPDHWEWRSNLFGNEISFNANAGTYGFYNLHVGGYWAEPSDSTKANFVGLSGFDWNGGQFGEVNMGLVIYSDVDLGPLKGPDSQPISPNADGSAGFWDFNGKFNSNLLFGPYDVVFSDKGDAARVPEGSSTAALLAVAGAVLSAAIGLGRFKRREFCKL